MSDDRELLLSILTIQLQDLPAGLFREIASAWQRDRRMSVLQFLRDRNLLSERDIRLLESLADESIRVCGNDPALAVAAFGGEGRLADLIGGQTFLAPHMGAETMPMAPQSFLGTEDLSIPLEEIPGRYTRISEQGRGGMGHVFLVHDRNMGRDVAYKELLPPSESAASAWDSPVRAVAAMTARFLREARVTAQLEHPSIVPVYEIGRRRGRGPYYTMKLVRGRTLASAFAESSTLEGRLHLLHHFANLCQAIAYAHDRGVIHRDIKPHNVMVGEFGETVVLDWGIAKVRREEDLFRSEIAAMPERLAQGDEEAPGTAYGAVLGTVQYMPPEQARGATDEIDERSDVYSLGVVLFELLTGTVPFSDGSPSEMLSAIVEGEPPTVPSLEPDAPPELIGICVKAMQKDPALRYPSAKALAAEVERFLTGNLVGAYTYSSWELLKRFYRRNRRAVQTGFVAGIVLLSVAIYAYVAVVQARDRERAQRIRAEHGAYLAQTRLVDADVDRKVFDAARSLLGAMPEPLRGWEWGFLLTRCNQDLATLRGHTGFVVDAKYDPAGDAILTVASDRTARLWDARRTVELQTFRFGDASILQGEFSPDGQLVALGLSDGTVRLVDAHTYAERRRLEGHASRVNAVAFSADGRCLATASADHGVGLWDLAGADGRRLLEGHRDEVLWVEFSADGRHLLSVSADHLLIVWETDTGNKVAEFRAEMGHFNPRTEQLVYWDDREAVVWDLSDRRPAYRVNEQTTTMTRAEFAPSGAWLVTGAQDGTIRLWRAETGEAGGIFNLGEAVSGVRVSPDDTRLAAYSREGLIGVWDITTGRRLVSHAGHGAGVATVRFSPDGRRLVSASFDQTAKIWDARQSTVFTTLTKHDGPITAFDTADDGSRLATVSLDSSMRILEPRTGRMLFQAAMRRGAGGTAVALSRDGKLAAVALDEFVPTVWRLDTHGIVARLEGHAGRVNSLAFSPTGERLLSSSWDQTVRVWNAESGEAVRVIAGHTGSVNGAVFSPDGQRIATGSDDGSVRIWNVRNGALLSRFDTDSPVLNVAFAHLRPLVAAACRNGSAKVWNTTDGSEVFSLTGHRSFVSSVAFNPDDTRMVTSSWDRKARIWDAATGEQFLALPALPDLALQASFSPDGQGLITADYVGNLTRWHASLWRSSAPAASSAVRQAAAEITEATESEPSSEAGHTVVVTTRDTALFCLGRLYQVLKADNEPDRGVGLPIPAGFRADACARLGIHAEDVLVRIDGAAVADKADALRALDPYQANPPPSAPPSMVVTRGTETLSFDYLYEEPTVAEERVTLKRDEAAALLKRARAALKSDLENILQVNRERSALIGESLHGRDQLSGLWLPGPLDPEDKRPFLELGLAEGDRITRIDGDPISSVAQLEKMIEDALARVASPEKAAVTVTIERGELTKLTKVINIE